MIIPLTRRLEYYCLCWAELAFERVPGETQRDSEVNGPQQPIGDLFGFSYNPRARTIRKRESKSRPGTGIVEFDHRAYNQDDILVAECRRQALMRMRPR